MLNAGLSDKTIFFLKNLIKGLLWLFVLLSLYLLIRNFGFFNFEKLLEPVFQNTYLIFTVYILSELFFGIIPPELFMLWALRTDNAVDYALLITVFAVLSYAAGFVGFLFGRYLNTTIFFRYLRKRFLKKYQQMLFKYGAFLILVAALTPIPYSAVSMLVGSFRYPMKNYLFWALSRFIRFAIYAVIIWHANLV